MEDYLAQIIMFAGNFAPRNWAYCQGQLLAIAQNQALFSLLGTTYGGDGRTTFALPNFIGRSPVGIGTGPGLSNISLGENGGSASLTLTINQIPAHTHTGSFNIAATNATPNSDEPEGSIPSAGSAMFTPASNGSGNLGGVTCGSNPTGGGQSLNLRQPYLVMNFIICLQGLFPSRN